MVFTQLVTVVSGLSRLCMKIYTMFRSLFVSLNVREFQVQDVLYLQALDGWCLALDPNWDHSDPVGELGLWDHQGILDRWVICTVSVQLVVPRPSSGFSG